jgi:hypothetical protein
MYSVLILHYTAAVVAAVAGSAEATICSVYTKRRL